ncbi:hypothetical protein DY000_02000725 [Brassica cretica]|uniref:LUC7 related protein n=1 Tax=Brassica cretica TaxID=69181 RepID=A0ABQ7BYB3_BRACR|nr:hypothetical protein DY000_02000725 [Brassica cretica]
MRTKRADLQAVLLLEAFNKDRAALPTPAQQPSAALPPPDPRTQEMINEKLKKLKSLVRGYLLTCELGMVDEAQKALEEAEALKKLTPRQEPVVDPTKYTAADVRITDQKLRLCDICGAFLSIYDSDRRLADHLGYMLIRDKLAELQEEKNKVHKERVEERRRGAESENQVKRETEEIAVTVVEILTVGIEIATGIMSMTETIISHAGMTQEAGAVRVPGRGKDQEIMIAADAMTAIKTAGDSCSKFKKFLEIRLESI